MLIVSMDGVRHDAPERDPPPAMARMIREGSRARALIPVFPSSTFPNHVSLATGAPSDRHGILGNRFRDRERGSFDYSNDASWIQAEPLWAAVERQGVPAAVFYWVGSETDWRGVGARMRRTPFDGSVGEDRKVEQILAWLDLPEAERPGLIMTWWHGSDRAGHRHGPDAAQVQRALREQDAWLGTLLSGIDERGLWQDLTLYLVSDHGMVESTEIVDPVSVLEDAGISIAVSYGMSVAHGFTSGREQAVAVREAWDRLPAVRALLREDLPPELRFDHPSRTGDVVAMADPPVRFAPHSAVRRAVARVEGWFGRPAGAHGYDPSRVPEMKGIWLATGRGIPAGEVIPSARVIDVAPSAARLLGLRPPRHSEGRVVPELSGGAVPAPDVP